MSCSSFLSQDIIYKEVSLGHRLKFQKCWDHLPWLALALDAIFIQGSYFPETRSKETVHQREDLGSCLNGGSII